VRAHGGSISAANSAAGAVFVMTLPAAGAEGSAS
jgi:signal transduction histidine kinase